MNMMYAAIFCILSISALAYDAPPTNCVDKNGTCYNGPHMDSFGQILSCSVPGTIALTFDDGPWEENTEEIVNELDRLGWKGTFFVIGKNIYRKNGKAVLAKIHRGGHQIAGHTHTHPRIPSINETSLRQEMRQCEDAILSVTGNLKPRYMRPPFGETTHEANAIIQSMGYVTPISWTFSNQDTSRPFLGNLTHALNIYKKHLGGENATGIDIAQLSIIPLQHDRVNSTAQSFKTLTKYLNDNFATKGVRFVTVAECLNDTSPYTVLDIKKVTNSGSIHYPKWIYMLLVVLLYIST